MEIRGEMVYLGNYKNFGVLGVEFIDSMRLNVSVVDGVGVVIKILIVLCFTE